MVRPSPKIDPHAAPRPTAVRCTRLPLEHSPAQLYDLLRELSETPPHPGSPQPAAEAVFSEEVSRAFDGQGTLRYTERLRLLRRAQQLGLGRFEANLVIAAVQHRDAGRETTLLPRPRFSAPVLAAIVLLIEAAILLAVWTVLRHAGL